LSQVFGVLLPIPLYILHPFEPGHVLGLSQSVLFYPKGNPALTNLVEAIYMKINFFGLLSHLPEQVF
jgi:hypothetical protein